MREGASPSLRLDFSVARVAVVELELGGGVVGTINGVFGMLGAGSTKAVVVDWTKLDEDEVGLEPLE